MNNLSKFALRGMRFSTSLAAILTCLLAASNESTAQVEVVQAFESPPRNPSANLVRVSRSGDLYGISSYGGASDSGTVFKIDASGSLSTIASFTGPNGRRPVGGLLQGADGALYGTTSEGGANDGGTIFRIEANSSLTTVASLPSGVSSPKGTLVQDESGNFYGTAEFNGVFRVTSTGLVTPIVTFTGANGAQPYAGLARASDGTLYGTTQYGGNANNGTVFKIAPGGTLTTLAFFNDSTTGRNPLAELSLGASGDLYGTAAYGGPNSGGTVFNITPSGTQTTLATFSVFQPAGGYYPLAGVVQDSNGDLYGATQGGGADGKGTLFKISGGNPGALSTIASFNGANGASPEATLVLGEDGNLYGTTNSGGAYNAGTYFRATKSGQVTTLFSFSGGLTGRYPTSGLVNGPGPSLYGTTEGGGGRDFGIVYKLLLGSSAITYSSFTGVNGQNGRDGLVRGPGGDIFGTTRSGGGQGLGTFFKIDLQTAIFPLQSFTTSNPSPDGTLTYGGDGKFYGVTDNGGTARRGTFFSITPAGALQALAAFGTTVEKYPMGPLVRADDGFFYGMTYPGDGSSSGSIFRASSIGQLSSLAFFNQANGGTPTSGLTQYFTGELYGATFQGGNQNAGVAFKFNPATGMITRLASFDGPNGSNPDATLLLAHDGNFYGTARGGGEFGAGTVFKLTPTGTLTVLASLNLATTGAYPFAPLVEAADGMLYGTTTAGGPIGGGTVFRLPLNAPPLRLTTIARSGNGNIRLEGTGPVNSRATIESSPDLTPSSFERVSSVAINLNGTWSFEVPTAGASRRFYRAVFP